MANFSIKDCIDLTLTELGVEESPKKIVIDYLNESQLQLDAEVVYARKKGDNYIAFSAGRSGSITLNSEVIDNDFLGLMLGATVEGGKITVGKDIPSIAFKGEGIFNVVDADGVATKKKITFAKLSPQVAADLTLSSTDISNFSLTLDVLTGADGTLLTMEDYVAV